MLPKVFPSRRLDTPGLLDDDFFYASEGAYNFANQPPCPHQSSSLQPSTASCTYPQASNKHSTTAVILTCFCLFGIDFLLSFALRQETAHICFEGDE